MAHSGIVATVAPGSIAEEIGLTAGDRLLTINGEQVKDIIDLSFALADESIELVIEKANGEQEIIEFDKDYDEDLGIEFESAVFDGVRRCANQCIFCFVDQMAPGLRESLYVKDDDYRLSFLYGNFVTLTNSGPNDINRIRRLHLSPLYISVHTTNPQLRQQMLNNKNAGKIMQQMNTLIDSGIEMHTQVVLCPGINDGEELEKTISDLHGLHPGVLSLAIVPVGLSKFRDNCYKLNVFSPQEALAVVKLVEKWQQRCRRQGESSFVYLSDEFYLLADYPLPAEEYYDDFPQIENGIGLLRNFLSEWEAEPLLTTGYAEAHYIDIVCGVSAAKVFAPLLAAVNVPNLKLRLITVDNDFFGREITVSGLLTGQDIEKALAAQAGPRTGVIIPGTALRKGEAVFLDNMTLAELTDKVGVPVLPADSGSALKQLLTAWGKELE